METVKEFHAVLLLFEAAPPRNPSWPFVCAYLLRHHKCDVPNKTVGDSLASISTRNSSVNAIGMFGGSATAQVNWMISFLSPNQGIGVG